MVGSITEAASFSFYPTKNLGAIGDGGATVFRDADAANRGTQLRQYGWDTERNCQRFGRNTRLDELQAAILRSKLSRLSADIARRRDIAATYDDGLRNLPLTRPKVREGCEHAYHQYVISVSDRDGFRRAMTKAGVGTAIHYTPANHLHPAYAKVARIGGALPRTEQAAKHVVSLPIFPELSDVQLSRVIDAIRTTLT
jgi:dTDP-4-amino-4,6-dideoxygalactose transaminase